MKILCWSCNEEVVVADVTRADGYCPRCDAPIDIEDYGIDPEHPHIDEQDD